MMILFLSLAGGLGAIARFVVDGVVSRHNPFRLPIGTMIINITGSFALGVLVGWAAHSASDVPDQMRVVLGTGFCGGYTTFSTASVETMRLWLAGKAGSGAASALVTLVGSLGAALLGMWLGGLGV